MARIALAVYFLVMALPLPATEIVAHRGSSHDFPENTLISAEQAWKEKADTVECDIYLTRDGKLVVMHDEDTKRTTGVSGKLGAMDLAEIQKLDAGLWKGAGFKGTKAPTLDELLAVGPANRKFFVEIKGGVEVLPELKACLERSGLKPKQVVIIAFDLAVLEAAGKELPEYARLWILSYGKKEPTLGAVLAEAKRAGVDGLDLSYKWPIDEAFVKRVKGEGLELHVWTVDDLEVAKRLAEAGVDGIATNRPGFIREGLGR